MTFQLDTTGTVATTDRAFWDGQVRWTDLTPFAQGYVEALFVSLREGDLGYLPSNAVKDLLRFDRLAPETLSRIVSDCVAMMADNKNLRDTKHDGRAVWDARQSGAYRRTFPPLSVVNGDGDLVVFL